MNGWIGVAKGIEKVVQSAVVDVPYTTARIVQHGIQLSTSVRLAVEAAVAPPQQPTQPKSSEGSMDHPSPTLSSTSSNTDRGFEQVRQRQPLQQSSTQPRLSIPFTREEKEKYLASLKKKDGTSDFATKIASSSSIGISSIGSNTIKDFDTAKVHTPAEFDDELTNGSGNSSRSPIRQHIPEGKAVPSTRIERALGFAQLGFGLAAGAISSTAGRVMSSSSNSNLTSPSSIAVNSFLNDRNSKRLTATLCRMRGAAMKMGQMLSIQDESLLPPALAQALQQVRQGADAMPKAQLIAQLEQQLGDDWRRKFVTFDVLPFAAASIGQVHYATITRKNGKTPRDVVVKVQYPGVAQSIKSDLRNLGMLVTWTGMAPKGLFIENVMKVGEEELTSECKYRNEMKNQKQFQELVHGDETLRAAKFMVPDVIDELVTDQVLTSAYVSGGTIDKIATIVDDQKEKNRIGRAIMYLTMQELFVWRFMQTDPNWGNFLYDTTTRTTGLIDFGATKEYSKTFVDGYLRIVWSAANENKTEVLKQSYDMGFLTGNENDAMIRAHVLSGFTVGEPFRKNNSNNSSSGSSTKANEKDGVMFDFRSSKISERMGEHTSVFMKHRLTPPPDEVYTLHRKLAGAYMLCIKLNASIECRDMLYTIVKNHKFEDGRPHPFAE